MTFDSALFPDEAAFRKREKHVLVNRHNLHYYPVSMQ